MDIDNWSKEAIEKLENLSDEEFLEILHKVGVECRLKQKEKKSKNKLKNIKEELDEHFANVSLEQFEENLIEAGIEKHSKKKENLEDKINYQVLSMVIYKTFELFDKPKIELSKRSCYDTPKDKQIWVDIILDKETHSVKETSDMVDKIYNFIWDRGLDLNLIGIEINFEERSDYEKSILL